MNQFETLLTSIMFVCFVAFVIFYDFEKGSLPDYDCNTLHKYDNVPDDILDECIRKLKPIKSNIFA